MLDSNIIISYILFNNKIMTLFFDYILNNENIIMSDKIEEELRLVFNKKFPNKINNLEVFLSELDCEKIITNRVIDNNIIHIRDIKDYPIFYSALIGNVDIFITGDKDFSDIKIEKPRIMSIREYLNEYVIK